MKNRPYVVLVRAPTQLTYAAKFRSSTAFIPHPSLRTLPKCIVLYLRQDLKKIPQAVVHAAAQLYFPSRGTRALLLI
jgi:hypothetical protein